MSFKLPKLNYEYDELEPFIDKETMKIHHSKHHAGYVKKLNATLKGNKKLQGKSVEQLFEKLDTIPKEIRNSVIDNGGGHANHRLFWKIMTPGGTKPQGNVKNILTTTFGGFSSFKKAFTETALRRFGSGWAWLVVKKGRLSIIDTKNQDSPIIDGSVPILGLDVWEHAYYLKYQNKRSEYVNAWWNVVSWKQVEKNFRNTLR